MEITGSLYQSLPSEVQHVIKRGYNVISKAETRIIRQLLDTDIIPIIDRSVLKSDSDIRYYAYDNEEQHTFVVPSVPEYDSLIRGVVKRKLNQRDSVYTLYDKEVCEYGINCHEPFVSVLSNINTFGPHALPLTVDRELPIEVKANIRANGGIDSMLRSTLRWSGRLNSVRSISKKKTGGEHFKIAASILTGRKNTIPAYGHWLVEILPRIRGIRYYEKKHNESVTIFVNSNITDWQIETLKLLGVDESSLKKWDGGRASVDQYVLPMWPKREWHISNIDWVRERIEKNVNYRKHMDRFSSRIYISREEMNRRQVINRERLVDAISKYGFKSYSPETMTFAEQVALYKNADILIGPKGSGLANMIFATDADIIELFPPDYFHLWQFELSQILNHGYYPIFGDKIDPQIKNHDQDCRIPPHQVTELLETIV